MKKYKVLAFFGLIFLLVVGFFIFYNNYSESRNLETEIEKIKINENNIGQNIDLMSIIVDGDTVFDRKPLNYQFRKEVVEFCGRCKFSGVWFMKK